MVLPAADNGKVASLFVLLNKVPGQKGECWCFKRNLLRAFCLDLSLWFPGLYSFVDIVAVLLRIEESY